MPELSPVLAAASPAPSFVVDGITYYLRFDLNALAGFKAKTGINISRQGVDLLDPELLRTALFFGMKRYLPAITEEEVGALIDIGNLGDIVLVLLEAITGSRPTPEAADEEAPTKNPPSA